MISYRNQNKAFISFEKYSQNTHLQEKKRFSQFHFFALSARKLTLQKVVREQIYTNVRYIISINYNLQPKSLKNVTAWVFQIILDDFRKGLIFFLCLMSQAALLFPYPYPELFQCCHIMGWSSTYLDGDKLHSTLN